MTPKHRDITAACASLAALPHTDEWSQYAIARDTAAKAIVEADGRLADDLPCMAANSLRAAAHALYEAADALMNEAGEREAAGVADQGKAVSR